MLIRDADADASGVLGRMRLDGLDRATVPFEARCVHAWQRGAPEPNMDVDMLVNVLWVRFIRLKHSPVVSGALVIAAGLLQAGHRTVTPTQAS